MQKGYGHSPYLAFPYLVMWHLCSVNILIYVISSTVLKTLFQIFICISNNLLKKYQIERRNNRFNTTSNINYQRLGWIMVGSTPIDIKRKCLQNKLSWSKQSLLDKSNSIAPSIKQVKSSVWGGSQIQCGYKEN